MLHLLCGSWLSAVKSALPVTVNAWRAWIPFCYQNHVPHFPIFPICPVFICLCFHLTFQNSSVLGVIVYTAHSSVLTYDQVENLFILIDELSTFTFIDTTEVSILSSVIIFCNCLCFICYIFFYEMRILWSLAVFLFRKSCNFVLIVTFVLLTYFSVLTPLLTF